MQGLIGKTLLAVVAPQAKPYEVRDTKLPGFILRVQPSGTRSYIAEYARHRRITIGSADVLSPTQARDRAKEILADAVRGIDPQAAKRAAKAHTFGGFLTNVYASWAEANLKRGKAAVARLASCFADLAGVRLGDLTAWQLEKWRAGALKRGRKPTGVNRDLDAIRAALAKAVEWKLLESHPLATVKRSKVDANARVRFLDEAEETRLRAALDAREERIRRARDTANEWRRARNLPVFPDLRGAAFADALKPMVLISANTGLRRGELFELRWSAIDLDGRILTAVGTTTKAGKTRHVPLNDEAAEILAAWREQTNGDELVFPGADGKRRDNVRKAWETLLVDAKVDDFRWHDLRHHFASRLVQEGVDLNTVRELLGHASLAMTLRYAHLAPEHRAAAVARIKPRTAAPREGAADG